MKVILMIAGLGNGGAEKQILWLAKALTEKGYDVKLISLTNIGAGSQHLLNADFEVKFFAIKFSKVWRFGYLIYWVLKQDPATIITFTYPANIFGRFFKLFGIRIVTSLRNEYFGSKFRQNLLLLTTNLDSVVVFNSKLIANSKLFSRLRLARERVVVIPNHVEVSRVSNTDKIKKDLRFKLGIPIDKFVWLAVGNHRNQKDYGNLLEACNGLECDFECLIAGNFTGDYTLEELINRFELDSRVRILGQRTDIKELMLASDAFVMSSAWEGMPNAMLEAISNQLPVVSTNVGGVPEIVIDNVNGFLCCPRSPELLGEAMMRMMTLSTEERLSMGKAGYDLLLNEYGHEIVANKWIEVLKA